MVNLQGLLLSDQEFETQLCLLAFHTIVWFLWLQIAPRYVQSWISSKQWKDRLVTHSKHCFEKGFKIKLEYHDAFTSACELSCIASQHIVGGILCTPSVLGFTGQAVWALARHGAMCEMGWELHTFVQGALWRPERPSAKSSGNPRICGSSSRHGPVYDHSNEHLLW